MSLFSSVTLHLESLAFRLCFYGMSVAAVVGVVNNTQNYKLPDTATTP